MSLPADPTGNRDHPSPKLGLALGTSVAGGEDLAASLDSFRVSLDSTCTRHSSTDEASGDVASAMEDSHAGRLAERYRLVERIGRGGFGEVWKAYDKVRGQYVAIKGPRPDRPITLSKVRSFLSEAQKARRLSHSRVVPVLDVVESPTGREGEFICFIVMKLMEGGSLAQKLHQEQKPSSHQAVRWLAALADTLAEIHAHGYVHRDIKPDNILFDERQRPYFSDFGLAVSVEEQIAEERHVLGTVTYMAPEQARGQHGSRSRDPVVLWSVTGTSTPERKYVRAGYFDVSMVAACWRAQRFTRECAGSEAVARITGRSTSRRFTRA